MSYIPSANDLLEVLPARPVPASTKTQSTTASQNKDNVISVKRRAVYHPHYCWRTFNTRGKTTSWYLREIFIKADEIANSPNGVTTAASSDERMRTVRSSTSDQPLTTSLNPRNRNLLQCKCKTNVWHLICEHALAAALNLWITFDYLVEVKKKILTSRKSKGFTKAVNMNPSIKEKGLKKSQSQNKCNKEMKSASSERQRFAAVSLSSKTPKGSSTSDQVISAGYIQPFSTVLILPNTQPIPSNISSFTQPFLIPSSKQPILNNTNVLTQHSSYFWHSRLPPYPYEIVVLPNNVSVRYGCHTNFFRFGKSLSI